MNSLQLRLKDIQKWQVASITLLFCNQNRLLKCCLYFRSGISAWLKLNVKSFNPPPAKSRGWDSTFCLWKIPSLKTLLEAIKCHIAWWISALIFTDLYHLLFTCLNVCNDKCCVFRPANGGSTHRSLVKIIFFSAVKKVFPSFLVTK